MDKHLAGICASLEMCIAGKIFWQDPHCHMPQAWVRDAISLTWPPTPQAIDNCGVGPDVANENQRLAAVQLKPVCCICEPRGRALQ